MPIDITMPRLSDTMDSGTVIKWNVKEGDEVSAGDAIADVETDKATMEMQVYDDGRIAKIVVGEGERVDVGTVIAVLAESGEELEEVGAAPAGAEKKKKKADEGSETKDRGDARRPPAAEAEEGEDDADREAETADEPQRTQPQRAAAGPQQEQREQREPAPRGRGRGNGRMRVSPVARQLADEYGVDLESLQGSGPSGRIIKRDVLQAVETGRETAAAVPPAAAPQRTTGGVPATQVRAEPRESALAVPGMGLEARRVPLSNMRQVIARRLVQSKTTIPHYQVTITFNMDPLLELREALNDQLAEQGVRLSVNDMLVRACALAMYEHPEFNASWAEDSVEIHGDVNIGVAVALPAERGGGLVVATIRNADRKSLRVISAETRHLAEKARGRGLSLEEMADSTFTISNLGMFGVEHFTAIINPPNSAILAVGAALQKPVVRDGQLTIGHEMSATLSLDHRVIDGAMAAQYLQTLKAMIESPATVLV